VERRYWVDHDHIRPEALQVAVHARQMHLQSVEAGPRGLKPQQAAFGPRPQVQPDGQGIPADFVGTLLENEEHAALAACTGGVGEMAADCRLARAGDARQQDAGTLEEPAGPEHCIEPRNAAWDDLV